MLATSEYEYFTRAVDSVKVAADIIHSYSLVANIIFIPFSVYIYIFLSAFKI